MLMVLGKAGTSGENSTAIFYPGFIYNEPEQGQAKTDFGNGKCNLRDHPGIVSVIASTGFFSNDGNIFLSLQGSCKQARWLKKNFLRLIYRPVH